VPLFPNPPYRSDITNIKSIIINSLHENTSYLNLDYAFFTSQAKGTYTAAGHFSPRRTVSRDRKSIWHEAVRRLLKQMRQEAELSQKELAARMGRPQTFISDVEIGEHRVSVPEFLEYCDALEMDPRSAIARVYRANLKPRKLKLTPRKSD
jgi:DNA-binding transcriptional regulator YiaG